MCTQYGKYFRKVLIEKTFADNFSFQPYPIAKIRLRLKSPCTKHAWSLPARSRTTSSPVPCIGTQMNLSKGESRLLEDKMPCLCS